MVIMEGWDAHMLSSVWIKALMMIVCKACNGGFCVSADYPAARASGGGHAGYNPWGEPWPEFP